MPSLHESFLCLLHLFLHGAAFLPEIFFPQIIDHRSPPPLILRPRRCPCCSPILTPFRHPPLLFPIRTFPPLGKAFIFIFLNRSVRDEGSPARLPLPNTYGTFFLRNKLNPSPFLLRVVYLPGEKENDERLFFVYSYGSFPLSIDGDFPFLWT